VHNNLNAKYALAFGINLQSQFAAVQPLLLRKEPLFRGGARQKSLHRYANDDENFVLVVPLTCGTRFKKIVLELVLVLELDC
jgi:hypothetical protein